MSAKINNGTKFENIFAPAHITVMVGDDDVPGFEIPLAYFYWDIKHMLENIAGFNLYSKYSAIDIVSGDMRECIPINKREGLDLLVLALVELEVLPLSKVIENGEIYYKRIFAE